MNNLLKLLQPSDYKSKLKLYCKDCIAQIPQKTIKTEKNRVKTIIITEIPCTATK